LMYYWLRARGLRVAVVTSYLPTRFRFRRHLNDLADQANGMRGVPRFLPVTQLGPMRRWLVAGNLLLIAIDGGWGRQAVVRGEDFACPLAAGPLRLAAITGAALVPCLIRAEPEFRCTIQFGEPVPDALLADRRQHEAALQHLVREFLGVLRTRPEQNTCSILQAFPELMRGLDAGTPSPLP